MAEPAVIKVSATVIVEMTADQHAVYEEERGGGFAALEIAARLRPELEDALLERRWLNWLRQHATITISNPVHVKITGEPERAAT